MLDIQKYIGSPKIIVDELGTNITKFEVRFLPRGFGHTIGNAMRRIMLWYDMGWAITGMKVAWCTHEYQVVDWVKQSIIDISLNLKILRFKFDESVEFLQRVPQKFSWVGMYTSDDLHLPSWIELVSEWISLFEITDPSIEFELDVRIEKWYGYYTIDFLKNREHQNDEEDVNVIIIDNDFRLVDYVKYDVEEVIDDFVWWSKDRLTLEVKMKYKNLHPKDFIAFSWEVLASYAKLFIFDGVYVDRSVLVEYEELEWIEERLPEEENIRTMPIDALPLSERTRNALIKNDVLYVEDLEKKKKWELLLMKWVWRKAIEEINNALWNIGKALAG